MAKWCAILAAAVLSAAWAPAALAQADLYACESDTSATDGLGLTLCNAGPTDALTARAEEDNLQVRNGALVVDLIDEGVTARAGLQSGDVIYRVGGVDVADADAAIASLDAIGQTSDTVVNFLRGGRPYRVKVRRE